MKTSELIKKLRKIVKDYGDLEIEVEGGHKQPDSIIIVTLHTGFLSDSKFLILTRENK